MGRSIIDLIHNRAQVTVPFPVLPLTYQPAGHTGFPSVATRPDQIESINSWISGICKDYPCIISLGAMHPEHLDPEVESMWMRLPRIRGIKLRSPNLSTPEKTGHQG
ncbi:MAG: hypothetical protein HF974_07360 [ANME-2 cluster archaeon]|nr:hypothetical protein [ANME-2 cluster archaeon]